MRFLYCLLAVSLTAISSLFAQSYPSYFSISTNSPVCEGQSFQLNVSYPSIPSGTSANFRWVGPNGFTSTSNYSITVPASAATVGVYSVTMTFSGTNQGTATASATVGLGTSKPMALVYDGQYAYSSRSICGPIDLKLAAYPDERYSNNAATYRWTGPNGFTSTERNPVVPQGVVGQYILEATYPGTCGVGRDTAQVYNASLYIYADLYTVGANPQYTGSLCPGDAVELRASAYSSEGTTTTYQWRGPNGFTSSAKSLTLNSATTAIAGTYSVTATFSGACSGTATTSRAIYPGTLSVYAYSSDVNGTSGGWSANTLCPGSDFRLYTSSDSPGATFRWSGPNGFTSSATSITLTNATAAMSGIYSVTATFPGGCSAVTTTQVTIGTPVISVSSYSAETNGYATSFCPGAAFKLTAAPVNSTSPTPISYQWSGPNGFTSSAQSVTLSNVTAAMAGLYSVTATFSGACAGKATATRTIQIGQPTLSIGSYVYGHGTTQYSSAFCPGSSIEVIAFPSTSSVPVTYQWSGPNGFTSSAQSIVLKDVTTAMAGSYSVTATFSGNCPGTASTWQTIKIGQPAVSINSNPYACSGGQLTLEASPTIDYYTLNTSATYRWSGPNGFTSSAKSFTLANMTPEMAGLYSVTATFSDVCTGTATASRQVQLTAPSVSISSRSTSGNIYGSNYCPGTSFDVYAYFYNASSNFPSSQSTLTYRWSGPNGFTSTAQQPTISNPSAQASGIYSLTVSITGECSGNYTGSGTINVGTPTSYISNYPLTGVADYNNVYCPGASVRLAVSNTPSDAPVASYLWSGPNGFTSSAQSLTLTNASAAMAGVYSVTTTYAGQCAGTRVNYTNVLVNTPDIYVSASKIGGSSSGTSSLCPGSTYQLSPSANTYNSNDLLTGNTFEWTLPNGTTSTTPSLTITNISSVNAGRYILKTTFGGVCAATTVRDSVYLYIGVSPPQVRAGNAFIGSGRSTTLYASYCSGPTIQWSDGQTGSSIVVKPAQTTNYTAICITYDGCTSLPSNTVTVRVSGQPEADLSLRLMASNRTPAVGQPVTVTLSISNSSDQEARNVQVESRLPSQLAITNAGSLQVNGTVLTTTIASIPAYNTVDLPFQVVQNATGVFRLSSQIMAVDNPDPDSWPASGTNDGQDDVSWVDLRTNVPSTIIRTSPEPNPAYLPSPSIERVSLPSGIVDLSLDALVSNAAPALNDVITITLRVNSYDYASLPGPELTTQLPAGLTFVGGTGFSATGQQVVLASAKYYSQWPQSFSFQARVTGPVTEPIKSRISYCGCSDVDSDPSNGFDTGEDDTAQVRIRVR